jgi:hypothetical protein
LLADWQDAGSLRALVAAVTRANPAHNGLAVWASWCLKYAEAIDPAFRVDEIVERFERPPVSPIPHQGASFFSTRRKLAPLGSKRFLNGAQLVTQPACFRMKLL